VRAVKESRARGASAREASLASRGANKTNSHRCVRERERWRDFFKFDPQRPLMPYRCLKISVPHESRGSRSACRVHRRRRGCRCQGLATLLLRLLLPAGFVRTGGQAVLALSLAAAHALEHEPCLLSLHALH
jgi:hypothetical protein